MTDLMTQPQVIADAAANVAGIRSAITSASASAASQTTGVAAAAADEVSTAIANLFGAYGKDYQALIGQAAAFHEQFVATLAAAGNAYAGAEAAATNLLGSLLGGNGAVAAADYTLVMGGSGTPIPSIEYINNVVSRYVNNALWPTLPFNAALVQGLFTPEGLYPLTAIKDLPLNISVQRGVQILHDSLVGTNPPYQGLLVDGTNNVNILGYSQSAVISSLEMRALNPTNTPGGSPYFGQLSFRLLGDPMNPNGGLLSRFAGLSLPSLGLNFYGGTPDNSFNTAIYTLEYDGYADFPQYPINFLSDLNAFAGILYVHGHYPTLTDAQLASAIHLTNTSGPTTTDYYMIPSEHLPLLNPVRSIPLIGTPIADLVEPDLRVLVNIGYGSTTQGWSPGPPNVQTGFGVIPPVTLPEVASALATATPQGINAFTHDLSTIGSSSAAALSVLPGAAATGVAAMPTLLTGLSTAATTNPIDSLIQSLQMANTRATDFVTNATASLYSAALPTADIANALVTSVPSYNVNLFLSGIEKMVDGDPTGGLIYALGAPIAADVALVTLAGGFELEVILNAVEGIVPS